MASEYYQLVDNEQTKLAEYLLNPLQLTADQLEYAARRCEKRPQSEIYVEGFAGNYTIEVRMQDGELRKVHSIQEAYAIVFAGER